MKRGHTISQPIAPIRPKPAPKPAPGTVPLHITTRNRHGNKLWLTADMTWTWDYSQRHRFTDPTDAYALAREHGWEVEKG